MPPARNNRAAAPTLRSRNRSPSTGSLASDDLEANGDGDLDDEEFEAALGAEFRRSFPSLPGDEELQDEEGMRDDDANNDDHAGTTQANQLPPRGLKEISSLASWTVSTSKPGCGVAALRSTDTSLFWQSDGPQPHLLSIHFFKLVSISHMRIYLDFTNDESYTPTKIQFHAGYGVHDLIEFAEMTFEQPKGWIDVDFSMVGPIDEDDETEENGERVIDWSKRPILRCFLLQVRILENHQNGKDTHLRGLQIFAVDERAEEVREREASPEVVLGQTVEMPERPKVAKNRSDAPKPKKASWMLEPELR